MRILLNSLFIIILAGCQSIPSENDATGVENRYVPEKDFARISEYFTGKENPGDRHYLRTLPEEREGYYWIIATPDSLKGKTAEVDLEVQIPGSPEIRQESFSVSPLEADTLWIGITGSDWPTSDTRPVAWQLIVRSSDGSPVLEKASYLWSPPVPTDESDAP